MKQDKAYKLLALQEGISNRAAKDLIDRGVVYSMGRKVLVARADMDEKTTFKVNKPEKPHVIFEDDKIIALDKPAFILSEEVAEMFGHPLLHRLDKETSGILLLVKDEEFREQAIKEFKHQRVEKVYLAVVGGKLVEGVTVDKPILTTKGKGGAVSKISLKGQEAVSVVEPMMVEGKNSLVKVTILTGRTHQIRVHLRSLGHTIIGDTKYGGKPADRMMLHAHYLKLLDYTFESRMPKAFKKYGFNV